MSERVTFVGALVVALVGCSTTPPRNNLSGKVLLGSEAVIEGIVTLHGPDGKQATSSIFPNGTYSIDDPPIGKCQITLQGIPAGATTGGGRPLKHGEKTETGSRPSQIPKKYGRLDNGLTVEFSPGRQTYDIVLEP
jgi:hypothetical protein